MKTPTIVSAVALGLGLFVFDHSNAAAQTLAPPLFAVLSGGNEVSAAGVANVGDPDGRGSATAIVVGNQLCWAITVTALGAAAPTFAHIHRGTAGTNGAVVVNLVPPAAGNPGTSSGCVAVAAALLNEIRTNSTGFYVNVHTAAFPGGAIRGQLF